VRCSVAAVAAYAKQVLESFGIRKKSTAEGNRGNTVILVMLLFCSKLLEILSNSSSVNPIVNDVDIVAKGAVSILRRLSSAHQMYRVGWSNVR